MKTTLISAVLFASVLLSTFKGGFGKPCLSCPDIEFDVSTNVTFEFTTPTVDSVIVVVHAKQKKHEKQPFVETPDLSLYFAVKHVSTDRKINKKLRDPDPNVRQQGANDWMSEKLEFNGKINTRLNWFHNEGIKITQNSKNSIVLLDDPSKAKEIRRNLEILEKGTGNPITDKTEHQVRQQAKKDEKLFIDAFRGRYNEPLEMSDVTYDDVNIGKVKVARQAEPRPLVVAYDGEGKINHYESGKQYFSEETEEPTPKSNGNACKKKSKTKLNYSNVSCSSIGSSGLDASSGKDAQEKLDTATDQNKESTKNDQDKRITDDDQSAKSSGTDKESTKDSQSSSNFKDVIKKRERKNLSNKKNLKNIMRVGRKPKSVNNFTKLIRIVIQLLKLLLL